MHFGGHGQTNTILKMEKMNLYKTIHIIKSNSLVGTPENIRRVMNEFIDLGITHFVLDLIGLDKDTIKMVDTKIIKMF
jgi:hypothetical protein